MEVLRAALEEKIRGGAIEAGNVAARVARCKRSWESALEKALLNVTRIRDARAHQRGVVRTLSYRAEK